MLHWETVSEPLRSALARLMEAPVLSNYRLVGGTALSLLLGHRQSVDIDLFTDAPYGSIDYAAIEDYLKNAFSYLSGDIGTDPAFGKSYLVGDSANQFVRLDIYYSSEPFFYELIVEDGIRIASLEDIIAMKIDVVQRGGRKKDFWDLHQLAEKYNLAKMIALHAEGFLWTHDELAIIQNFTDFSSADKDFDPICLRGKQWPFIKEDLESLMTAFRKDGTR